MTFKSKVEEITKNTVREITGFPSLIGNGGKSLTPMLADRILALIAADRAELVEALEYSKHKFQELKDAKMLNTTRIIAKIDKALEVK